MSAKTKTFLFQLVSFGVLFFLFRYLLYAFTSLEGVWLPIASGVIATVLAPQFKVFQTDQGDKICVKWIFFKGTKVL